VELQREVRKANGRVAATLCVGLWRAGLQAQILDFRMASRCVAASLVTEAHASVTRRRAVSTKVLKIVISDQKLNSSEGSIMTENNSIACRNCGMVLFTAREKEIHWCSQCRRYGLLHGHWPESNKMSVPLSSVSISVIKL
jgi:hypothetical protein